MRKNMIVAVAMCLASSLSIYAQTKFTTDNINYTTLKDREGCVEVTVDYSKYKGDMVIPSTVTNAADGKEYTVIGIGKDAFCYTYGGLKSIKLPNTIEYLAEKSFNGARGLKSFEIPESVQTIALNAFSGCSGIAEFTVAEGNKNYSSKDGIIFDKAQTTLYTYPIGKADEEYTIPDGVTTLGESAFVNVTNLKKVVLDKALTTVNNRAFSSCTSLRTLDFTGLKIETLGERVFGGCKMLGELNLSAGSFTKISASSFYNCSALVKLYLPATAATIDDYAFNGLKALEELHMAATAPAQFSTAGKTFSPINNELTVLYVPKGCKAAYEADQAYAGCFKDIVEEGTETAISSVGNAANAAIALQGSQIVFGGNATDIHVFDMTGKEVLRQGQATAVSVAKLGKGLYVAKAVVGGKAVAAKVCIK